MNDQHSTAPEPGDRHQIRTLLTRAGLPAGDREIAGLARVDPALRAAVAAVHRVFAAPDGCIDPPLGSLRPILRPGPAPSGERDRS